MTQCFKAIYGLRVADVIPMLGSWWPDDSSDMLDEEFAYSSSPFDKGVR